MKDNLYYWIGGGILILIVAFGLIKINTGDKKAEKNGLVEDYKNATYIIDKNSVTLVNGVAEQDIPFSSSSAKLITQYFGNEVRGDFNADSFEDVAFLLTQKSIGSGTFYYLVLALGKEDGYLGSNAILLGDRIAPQTTNFADGLIISNYAERKVGDPFTTVPSVGMSRYFKVSNDGFLVETSIDGKNAVSVGNRCELSGGEWSSEFKECLRVDKIMCESIGGEYNECASACRHNPNAQICTLQCVMVCEFN